MPHPTDNRLPVRVEEAGLHRQQHTPPNPRYCGCGPQRDDPDSGHRDFCRARLRASHEGDQETNGQVQLPSPLEKALQFFADRTGTMLSRRTAMLVSEANKSGGDIQESMESIAKHVQEIQYLERKRRATLRPFIGVMYISFAVFLVTVYLLISSFFKQLANTTFGGSS